MVTRLLRAPSTGADDKNIGPAVWWLGVTVALPCVFLTSALDPALLPRFLGLSLLSSLAVLYLLTGSSALELKPSSDASRLVFALVLAYLACGVISLSVAVNVTEGFFDLSRTALMLSVLLISTVLLVRDATAPALLARAIAASAAMHAVIGVCQYHELAFTALRAKDAICSTMVNKNLYASFLFLGLPFQLYGALTFSGPWRWVSIASVQLVVHAIVLSQTRSVWLAILIAGVSLATLLYPLRGKLGFSAERAREYRRRASTAILLSVAVVAVTLYSMRDTSLADMVLRRDAPISSARERLRLWAKTAEMILEHPVMGVGAGNWKIMVPKYGTRGLRSEGGETHFQRPHNDLLLVIAETGPVAGLIYMGLFAVVLGINLRTLRHASSADHTRLLALLAIFGITGYLVIGAFSYPRERIEHSVYLMLLFAVSLAGYHAVAGPGYRLKRLQPIYSRTPLLLVLGACVVLGYERLTAEVHTKRALSARERAEWPAVVREIDAAESLFANMDPAATPLAWYRGVANFTLGRGDAALRDFKEAYADHPHHVHVLNNLGTCHELRDDHEKALTYYNKALKISPTFGETLLNLAAVYHGQGDYTAAHTALLSVPAEQRGEKHARYVRVVEQALAATASPPSAEPSDSSGRAP